MRTETRALAGVILPTVATIEIRSSTVDEWYGIDVDVTFVEPFAAAAFREAVEAEKQAWFAANPRQAHVGPWPLERGLFDHVVSQVIGSAAWETFYATPRRVTCEEYEDGPEREVVIPRFRAADFGEFDWRTDGAWLSASDRD